MVRLNINNEESGIAYLRYFISKVLIAIAIAVNNWATPGSGAGLEPRVGRSVGRYFHFPGVRGY